MEAQERDMWAFEVTSEHYKLVPTVNTDAILHHKLCNDLPYSRSQNFVIELSVVITFLISSHKLCDRV